MHIIPDHKEPSSIFFEFFEDTGNYNKVCTKSARRFDFNAAMVANDLRSDRKEVQKEFIVVLFKLNKSKVPFTAIHFRKNKSAGWSLTEMPFEIDTGLDCNYFVNAFIVNGD